MQLKKKVIGSLNKCYCVAPLIKDGKPSVLIAAEKTDPCYRFDLEGNQLEKLWDGPGGVMSMAQVPGSDGIFLTTQEFYSPNDSKKARISSVTPQPDGSWRLKTLVDLPFVHRFDILPVDGVNYLIACTVKSGHEYKDDWSVPGKVYVAVLPEDLTAYDSDHQLSMSVLKEDMLKNHGYLRTTDDKGRIMSLISSDEGVFSFAPPAEPMGSWEIKQLIDVPASDAVLVDLDGDGRRELILIRSFHGDCVEIYRESAAGYELAYSYDHAEFAHAIYGGVYGGEPCVIIGHRKGARNLVRFFWDGEKFTAEILDEDCGPANIYVVGDTIFAANRETDEMAMYQV